MTLNHWLHFNRDRRADKRLSMCEAIGGADRCRVAAKPRRGLYAAVEGKLASAFAQFHEPYSGRCRVLIVVGVDGGQWKTFLGRPDWRTMLASVPDLISSLMR